MTPWIRDNGYQVDALQMAYHWNDGAVRRKENNITMLPNGTYESNNYALTDWAIGKDIDPDEIDSDPHPYYLNCPGEDNNSNKGNFGTDLSPWELIFVKMDRGINPLMYDLAANWADGSGYSSYDFCK